MTTTNEDLMEKLHALHTDLAVHIAKDEGQWEKIADAEADIRDITKDAARVSKKQAAIMATLSGGAATLASVITKAFL